MAPTLHLNAIDAGAKITSGNHHWGTLPIGQPAGPISFGFRDTAPTYTFYDFDFPKTFARFSSEQMVVGNYVIGQFAEVANITFSAVNPGGYTNNATILFANWNQPSSFAGGVAAYPGSTDASSSAGDVWINSGVIPTQNITNFHIYLHELGHALGLQHPGAYNAGPNETITYETHAEFVEDSQQYTVMSYFRETKTGANFVFNGSYEGPSTPLMFDISAMQRLYGANMSTRTGDTTYGFNSNAGEPYSLAGASEKVVCCVWDAGGTDTFDFSGYANNQRTDLHAEGFSSVGPLTFNVSIAAGATIENASGGSGNDLVLGNAVRNILVGNGGNDFMTGDAGGDSIYGNLGDDAIYGNFDNDSLFGGQGNDTVFGGQGVDAVYGNLGNDAIYGNLGDDVLFGGQGDDLIFAGQGADVLSGNIGNDTVTGGLGGDTYSFSGSSGSDKVLDFSGGAGDRVSLNGQSYMAASDGQGGTLLTLSGGGVVHLVAVASFDSAWLI